MATDAGVLSDGVTTVPIGATRGNEKRTHDGSVAELLRELITEVHGLREELAQFFEGIHS